MQSASRDRHLKIVVAALTRRRPAMLKSLLSSWEAMELPENATVRCLVIENDDEPKTQSLVKKMTPLGNGIEVDYALETTPGIPFARNRAAKEAIGLGADLLGFVDDDEIVARDWLVHMVEGYRNGEAVLLGGPRRIAAPAQELTMLERVMHENIVANFRQIEDRAAATSTLSSTPKVNVFTNNWLAETHVFSKEGIWFDENMRFTGGTDSKFCAEVRAAGHAVGWVKDAHVFETIPRERLSFAYQHGRARDQINNLFHQRIKVRPLSRYTLALRLPRKLLEVVFLAISVPLTRGRTLLKLAKATGWIAGRVGAAFGIRSTLYKNITGG